MNPSRRTLLKAAAALPFVLTMPLATVADALVSYTGPIIDSHFHIWDLSRQKLPWLDRAGPPLNQSYSLADYARAIGKLPITRAVYIEVAIDSAQRKEEADFASKLTQTKPAEAEKDGPPAVPAAVIAVDPAAESFATDIANHARQPGVKGIRAFLPKGAADDKRFIASLRKLGELGLSFDLLINEATRADCLRLAELCPDTSMVLDHCGNTNLAWFAVDAPAQLKQAGADWKTFIAKLAERKNVVCKISGVAESAKANPVTAEAAMPIINSCLDRFGEDRVLFGTNWPVCLKTISLQGWHELLTRIIAGRGDQFARKLMHDNAARVYRI